MSVRLRILTTVAACSFPLLGACADARPSDAASLGDEPSEVESVLISPAFDSARTLYSSADFEPARLRFREIAAIAGEENDLSLEARALTWAGLASWRLGDYEDARRTGEAALQLKRDADLGAQLWRSFNGLGLLAWNEGRLLDAADLLRQAASQAEYEDPLDPFKTDSNLGLVFTALGQFEDARTHFLRALGGFEAASATDLEARVLTNLAALEVDLGHPAAALDWLERAMVAYDAAEDPVGHQNAVGQMGSAWMAVGNPEEGFRWLDSALVLSRSYGLRQEEASNLELLADAHQDAGDAVRALELYQEAAAINEDLGLRFEAATDLRKQAEILSTLGSVAAGIRAATDALRLHEAVEARNEVLKDHLTLSFLNLERDSLRLADAHLQVADTLGIRIGSDGARIAVAIARGRLHLAANEPQAALDVLDPVLGALDRTLPTAAWEVHTLRARALRAVERGDDAIAAATRAVVAVERVRGRFASALLRRSYGAVRMDAYRELIELLLGEGRVDRAFEVADAARGRPLRAALTSAPASDTIGDPVIGRLRTHESRLRTLDYLAFTLDSLQSLPEDWRVGDYDEEVRRIDRALATARREASSAAAPPRNSGGRTPSDALFSSAGVRVADVRRLLAGDEAVIQYLVTDDGVHLFLVTPERTLHRWVEEPRRELEARVRLARSIVGSPDRNADGAAGVLVALYERLLGPLNDDGALDGMRRLVLLDHDQLVYLPFATLLDPATREPIVQRWALTHAPSAEAWVALRRSTRTRAAPAPEQLAAAALAPFPSELPASIRETDDIATVLPGVAVFQGPRASESRLRLAFADADVVHVATHAALNPRNPLQSYIRLASGPEDGDPEDDATLHVAEILEQRVSASLVFLSGCETDVSPAGRTTFAPGDDYASLAQALLYAGAEHVIATLWPVRDDASAEFARRFYEGLPDTRPADALVTAQRRMRADERFSHPFYWAAYRISGASAAAAPQRTAAGDVEPG